MFRTPSGWRYLQLVQTAYPGGTGFNDGDWIEAPFITTSGIRLIQTGNVGLGEFLEKPETKKFISEGTFQILGCKWVHPGDILICRLADPIGRACVVPANVGNSITAVDCTIYRPLPEVADRRFMLHWLNSAQHLKAASDIAGGSTRQRISRSHLGALEVLLPPIPEQRRIAAVLDTVEEAITKTEVVIAKLKQVRAGLLHDLLTRGLDEHGQLRDPIAHPEQFKDSLLGRIPREWEMKTLLSLCIHIGSGVTPRGGQDVYISSGIMFIRSQNVTFEGLLLNDVAYIPDNIHLGMLRSEVFPHDVLFNITGASIGRCCQMPEGLGTANVNQHVCILRVPEADAADAKYFASILSSPIGQRQLDALNTIGNRQGLNYQQLGSFVIPWPNGEERYLIASNISALEDQYRAEEAECAKLHHLKSALMSDLLTGRVRVPADIFKENP